MTPHFFVKLMAVAVLLSTAMAEELRDWTSRDGRTISGKMTGSGDDLVKVKLATGKVVEIPYKVLIEADVNYARQQGVNMRPEWPGWPHELRMNLNDVKISVDQSRSGSARNYYITDHFEIKSQVELGSRLMLDVGRIFELTYQLIEASPWGIMANPEGGRFKAELYATRKTYVAAGAPEWSGGVYMLDKKVFMVPIESLGIKRSNNGYRRDESFSLDTVVHEITHMLMADTLPHLPIAVTEGIAEYISHIPLRQGAFRPGSVLEIIRKTSEKRKPLKFETLLQMTASEWSGTAPTVRLPEGTKFLPPRADLEQKSEQYHASLLLAYHLMHGLDDGEPERLRELIYRAQAKTIKREALIEDYEKKFAVYRSEIKEFLKHPEVTDTGDGKYSYPSNLTPPQAPDAPFEVETEEQLQLGDLEIILAGQSTEDFVRDMVVNLKSLKIELHE